MAVVRTSRVDRVGLSWIVVGVWARAKPCLKSGLRAPGGQVVQQVRVANVIKVESLEFQNRKRANSLDSGLKVNEIN